MVPLYASPVLMIEQPKKFLDTYAEYHVLDEAGKQVASVKEYRYNARSRESRLGRPQRFGVYGADGKKLLVLDKPKGFFQSCIHVYQKRRRIGSIVRDVKFVGSKFTLNDQHGEPRGEIIGNWSGWDFQILRNGGEVARIGKKFPGLAKAMFTTEDRYALEFQRELPKKLRKLVIAGAIAIDVLLHEDQSDHEHRPGSIFSPLGFEEPGRGRVKSRRSSAGSLLKAGKSRKKRLKRLAKKKFGGGKKGGKR